MCSLFSAPSALLGAGLVQHRLQGSGNRGGMNSGWGVPGSSGSGGGAAGAPSPRGRRLSIGPASAGGRAQSYPGPDDNEAGLLQKLLKRRSSGAMQMQQVGTGGSAAGEMCWWRLVAGGSGCLCVWHMALPVTHSNEAAINHHPSSSVARPQQPLSSAQLRRNRDKLVALLEEGQYALLEEVREAGASLQPSPTGPPGLPGDDELLPAAVEEALPSYYTGRITIHCTAARWAMAECALWVDVDALCG